MDKELRARCEARLRALELPEPFSAQAFCALLAAQRGRPILLQPVANRAGPWGLWVATAATDYIFYEQETSPLHQEHIILHEACHILCAHRATPIAEAELPRLLFPDLCPEMVQRVLQRTSYSTPDELEAELLASLTLERVMRTGLVRPISSDSQTTTLLGRLGASLETRTRESE
ncbi:hypothetical protein [Nitrolancea hollandica]|uniref:IrrE N-terminal-like domain-containing protein n=1 Tax=Nitrolancea hollandica Lb TaxID=1129897 RepID=I4EL66_9BACT|nr:hypothetical protein [Nitrolancea hollandica]CCF85428.1 conserved hypothetical protein [Nitrolancea hollandica Lb]